MSTPPNAGDRSFRYIRQGYEEAEVFLRNDLRILNGPGFNEYSWAQKGACLTFKSADNVPRVVMTWSGRDEFIGQFVNSGAPTPARLVPLRLKELDNSVAYRIGNKTIRWVFGYEHDMRFMVANIAPWALPDAERVEANDVDFTVGVYPLMFDKVGGNYVGRAGIGIYYSLTHNTTDNVFVLRQRHAGAAETIEFQDFTQVANPQGMFYRRIDAAGIVVDAL